MSESRRAIAEIDGLKASCAEGGEATAAGPCADAEPAEPEADLCAEVRALGLPNVEAVPVPIEELDRPTESFDSAVLVNVLEHIEDGSLIITPGDRSDIIIGAIAAISVTPDRQQYVDFTNVYYVGKDGVRGGRAIPHHLDHFGRADGRQDGRRSDRLGLRELPGGHPGIPEPERREPAARARAENPSRLRIHKKNKLERSSPRKSGIGSLRPT
jgi:hypothetical protein